MILEVPRPGKKVIPGARARARERRSSISTSLCAWVTGSAVNGPKATRRCVVRLAGRVYSFCRGARCPSRSPRSVPRPRRAARMGERWVEEGPIELTDAERVSVDVADGKARLERSRDHLGRAPVETPAPVVPSPVRGACRRRYPDRRASRWGHTGTGGPRCGRPESWRIPTAAREPAQEGRAAPRAGGESRRCDDSRGE